MCTNQPGFSTQHVLRNGGAALSRHASGNTSAHPGKAADPKGSAYERAAWLDHPAPLKACF